MKAPLTWIFALFLACSMSLVGCEKETADKEKAEESAEEGAEEAAEEGAEEGAKEAAEEAQPEPGLTDDEKAALSEDYEEEAVEAITMDNAMEEAEALEKQLEEELTGLEQ